MASYQDLAQKIEILEDKIDLVMQSIVIQKKVGVIDPKIIRCTLKDLYYAAKGAGLAIQDSAPTVLEMQSVGQEPV